MALELEMVDPQLNHDLGMFLFIVQIKDGTDKAGHNSISKIYEERFGLKHKVATHAATSERSAKCIAKFFNQDEDACGMHHYDKVIKSSIADLVITKNKVQCFQNVATFKLFINSNPQIVFFINNLIINPFPEAYDLLNKAHEIGTHFSYVEKRHKELCSHENSTSSGLANVCTKLDLNKTRMSSRKNLVNSMLRLHK